MSDEFRTLRGHVEDAVRHQGYEPVSMDNWTTGDGELLDWHKRNIASCEGLIQIVGSAYGGEPEAHAPAEHGIPDGPARYSYTQWEFYYARQIGKKTWVILPGEACTRDTPGDLLDLPRNPATDTPDATLSGALAIQAERRALQKNYLNYLAQSNHLSHHPADDKELKILVLKLRDLSSETRSDFTRWQNSISEKGAKQNAVELLVYLVVVLSVTVISDPWIVEENRIARIKIVTGLIVAYITFKLVKRYGGVLSRVMLIGLLPLAFLAVSIATPTFPLKVLDYVPSPEDYVNLEFSESLGAFEAYKAGIVHYIKRDYSTSEKAFRYASSDKRMRPYATNRLAAALRLQDKNSEAIEAYKIAIREAPQAELAHERSKLLWNSWQDHGWTLRRMAQKIQKDPAEQTHWQLLQEEAYNSFITASKYDPRSHQSLFMAGQVNIDRHEYWAARDKNLRAYYINTEYSRATYNLAMIEAKLNNPIESLRWLERTFQIDGTQAYSAENEESFSILRGDPNYSIKYGELVEDAKHRVSVPD